MTAKAKAKKRTALVLLARGRRSATESTAAIGTSPRGERRGLRELAPRLTSVEQVVQRVVGPELERASRGPDVERRLGFRDRPRRHRPPPGRAWRRAPQRSGHRHQRPARLRDLLTQEWHRSREPPAPIRSELGDQALYRLREPVAVPAAKQLVGPDYEGRAAFRVGSGCELPVELASDHEDRWPQRLPPGPTRQSTAERLGWC